MIKEVICTAASIDEARALAIEKLNAPEDADVSTEVLEMPVKKTLGFFGGSPAKVRAYYEASDFSGAESYIAAILKGLGIEDAKIDIKADEEDIRITLDCGDDYGAVIGRRGETLDAIQYLTRLVVNRGTEGFKRVSINAGDYRERREAALRLLARRNSEKVKKYGRSIALDPMNPFERRIIHTTVQEIDGVDSHSVGLDSERRVVLTPAGGTRQPGAPEKKPFKQPDSENPPRQEQPKQPQAQQPAPRSDVSKAARYGKIEPPKKD